MFFLVSKVCPNCLSKTKAMRRITSMRFKNQNHSLSHLLWESLLNTLYLAFIIILYIMYTMKITLKIHLKIWTRFPIMISQSSFQLASLPTVVCKWWRGTQGRVPAPVEHRGPLSPLQHQAWILQNKNESAWNVCVIDNPKCLKATIRSNNPSPTFRWSRACSCRLQVYFNTNL